MWNSSPGSSRKGLNIETIASCRIAVVDGRCVHIDFESVVCKIEAAEALRVVSLKHLIECPLLLANSYGCFWFDYSKALNASGVAALVKPKRQEDGQETPQ